jgi:undecaprenyl-diphosphatase
MLSFLFPLFYKRKNWLLLLLFSVGVVVVFSRIYLGVHYLSDVAAGASFGILIGSLVYYLFRKFFIN